MTWRYVTNLYGLLAGSTANTILGSAWNGLGNVVIARYDPSHPCGSELNIDAYVQWQNLAGKTRFDKIPLPSGVPHSIVPGTAGYDGTIESARIIAGSIFQNLQ